MKDTTERLERRAKTTRVTKRIHEMILVAVAVSLISWHYSEGAGNYLLPIAGFLFFVSVFMNSVDCITDAIHAAARRK